ncbi:MAG: dynamin family protein [Proteobacteria bacterium]|nr:dynamin family protein [Pseudomonadota bacterium]
MDLAEYEQAKLELAAILRSMTDIIEHERPDRHAPFRDLFARLAEDRFNLVVVGRFSRGKTSLMNAMLGTERLPTGLVPLTSVITTVSYGTKERAFIEHEGWNLPNEIALDELPDYVTQQRNPGNIRKVKIARIELPAELLRRGFHFVDTPGLGSSILENTQTTERFLPQADAFILVTSYDSPLSVEEKRVLQEVGSTGNRLFLVVNKQDIVSPEERELVLRHIRDEIHSAPGKPLPSIFSVSARNAIEASRRQDEEAYARSGIATFKEEVVRFLLTEKQSEFLRRMCERTGEALRAIPNSAGELHRLELIYRRINRHQVPLAPLPLPVGSVAHFSSCWVCSRLGRRLYDFLCQYQYDIAMRPDRQAALAEAGGLCPFHAWRYARLASTRGTCIAFPGVLEFLAGRLRHIAETASMHDYAAEIGKLRPTPFNCALCRAHRDLERETVASTVKLLTAEDDHANDQTSDLCLNHLQLVIETIGPGDVARNLLVREASNLERVSGDMRRYVLKHDGVRRFLASSEEQDADQRGLALLAGHQSVTGG